MICVHVSFLSKIDSNFSANDVSMYTQADVKVEKYQGCKTNMSPNRSDLIFVENSNPYIFELSAIVYGEIFSSTNFVRIVVA